MQYACVKEIIFYHPKTEIFFFYYINIVCVVFLTANERETLRDFVRQNFGLLESRQGNTHLMIC